MIFDETEKEELLNDRNKLAKFNKDIRNLIGLKNNETIEEFKTEYVRLHCDLCKQDLLNRLKVVEELLEFINRK